MTIISIILTLLTLVFVWRLFRLNRENSHQLALFRLQIQDLFKEKLLLENQVAGRNLDSTLNASEEGNTWDENLSQ